MVSPQRNSLRRDFIFVRHKRGSTYVQGGAGSGYDVPQGGGGGEECNCGPSPPSCPPGISTSNFLIVVEGHVDLLEHLENPDTMEHLGSLEPREMQGKWINQTKGSVSNVHRDHRDHLGLMAIQETLDQMGNLVRMLHQLHLDLLDLLDLLEFPEHLEIREHPAMLDNQGHQAQKFQKAVLDLLGHPDRPDLQVLEEALEKR